MKFRKKTGAAILTFLLALSVGTGFVSSAENEQDAIENNSLEELDTLKVKNNVRLETLQRGIEQARKQYESASKAEIWNVRYVR